MKEKTIKVLKNKNVLFILDKILPCLPLVSFLIIGMIFSHYNVTTQIGWLAIIVPILFFAKWAVWIYKVRPTLNLPEKKSSFWKHAKQMSSF